VNLTSEQQAIVDAKGDFLLLACPGSGKTRSAAARVGRLASERGRKVAACSYTNVGAERLATVIAREVGTVLGPEHFTGTIHGFLLRYVFYPFAHLLGARRGPHVREGRGWPDVVVGGDNSQRVPLDDFRMDPTGELVLTASPRFIKRTDEARAQLVALIGQQVKNRKNGIFRSTGAVTADDAMWRVLEILRGLPQVAASVASRFDELLLDEAQDTSQLQLACVEVLRGTGKLKSLVLIGDLEQSIYSFQGASAAGCRQLAENTGLRIERLTENHRCSQLICNVAARFSSRENPDTAVGEHAACEIVPEVLVYPVDDPIQAMTAFRARLEKHGIEPSAAAVMARRWKVAHRLNGVSSPVEMEERPFELGRLAADLAAGRLGRSQVQWAQRMIAYAAWDISHLDELDDEQRATVRAATYGFVRSLPALDGDLRTWIQSAAQVLNDTVKPLVETPAHGGGNMIRSKTSHSDHSAAEVFSAPVADLSAQTVHSMKGEEADAVMVVIHPPHGNDPTTQLELWEKTVAGDEIEAEREEERRVTFVALTRAQRFCLVAVPDTKRGRDMAAACTNLGFVPVGGGAT
jgi:DNA helicase II / ATP-dependent DNA helicase PcrA